MNLLIRCDASNLIGSGHVMRCLVIAEFMKLKGWNVSFACRKLPGNLIKFIAERGFVVLQLKAPAMPIIPKHNADYSAWLQVSVEDDAKELIEVANQVDFLIVDHYGLNRAWESAVSQGLAAKLLAIDDLVREHAADLILDQTLGRKNEEYSSVANVLAGSEYALLKPQFGDIHKLVKQQAETSPIKGKVKALISFGGIDAPNCTLETLSALAEFYPAIGEVTVLLSKNAPHYHSVKEFCTSRDWIKHIEFTEDMANLMLKHDIAIGAPGTTSWERACIGLPSVIVPIAENQQEIARQLSNREAAVLAELGELSVSLKPAIENLLLNYRRIIEINLGICDGLGVQRVYHEIMREFSNDARLRNATADDIELVYQWQCQPATRKYALNPNIPSWQEHKSWMSKKLQEEGSFFYIIQMINGSILENVGVVRLDPDSTDNNFIVSILISSEFHGRGIASLSLSALDKMHPEITINATVLPENKASQKLFQKAGYSQINENTFERIPLGK